MKEPLLIIVIVIVIIIKPCHAALNASHRYFINLKPVYEPPFTDVISFLLKETVHPEKVLSGGGQLPLGGTEITSKLLIYMTAYRFKGHGMVLVRYFGSVSFRLPNKKQHCFLIQEPSPIKYYNKTGSFVASSN